MIGRWFSCVIKKINNNMVHVADNNKRGKYTNAATGEFLP
jgi:hypothetical protein